MNEIIVVGGENYTATNVTTGTDAISFTISGLTVEEVHTAFKNARSLTLGDGTNTYGNYPNVEFESITIDAEEDITVVMHILNRIEVQIRELQAAQAELQVATAEHDKVIATMIFGGEA